MYLVYYLPYLKWHAKVANFFQSIKYRFDSKINRFVPIKSKWVDFMFNLQHGFAWVYCWTLFLYVIFVPGIPVSERIKGLMYPLQYMDLLFLKWDQSKHNRYVQVINSCLMFEEKILKEFGKPRKPTQDAKRCLILIQVIEVSILLIPIFVGLLILASPCSPPFILSMFDVCREITWNRWQDLPLFIVMLFEVWMSYHLFYATCMWSFFCFFVGVGCFSEYMVLLERGIKGSGNLCISASRCVRLYREVHLLEKFLNDYLNHGPIQSLMISIPGDQIIGMYVLVAHHRKIQFPSFMIYPICILDTLLMDFLVFTGAFKMYEGSCHVREAMKRRIITPNKKCVYKRQVRALDNMKIKFGTNYVDKGTPLTLQDFIVHQTISLILLEEE